MLILKGGIFMKYSALNSYKLVNGSELTILEVKGDEIDALITSPFGEYMELEGVSESTIDTMIGNLDNLHYSKAYSSLADDSLTEQDDISGSADDSIAEEDDISDSANKENWLYNVEPPLYYFRAISFYKGHWVYGSLFRNNIILTPTTPFRINPKTICQYTSINDIYGVRIFEGDIVKIIPKNVSEDNFIDEITGEVIYDVDCAAYVIIGRNNKKYNFNLKNYNYEVIGNIFD